MPSPPKVRSVSPKELDYYRAHFLEAIREDAVVCLECGTIHRALGLHLRLRHSMGVDTYKAAWGYNAKTALMIPAVRERHRQTALDIDLASKSPPNVFLKMREARQKYVYTHRAEARRALSALARTRAAAGWNPAVDMKVKDETLRQLAAEGLTIQEISHRSGLKDDPYLRKRLRALGLLPFPRRPISNDELLALRKAGLWPSQIAARTGMPVGAVHQRFERLRRLGVKFPRPSSPMPSGNPRVSDDEIIKLVRSGLKAKEIAARVGLSYLGVAYRLRVLRRRGLLPHTARSKTGQPQE